MEQLFIYWWTSGTLPLACVIILTGGLFMLLAKGVEKAQP